MYVMRMSPEETSTFSRTKKICKKPFTNLLNYFIKMENILKLLLYYASALPNMYKTTENTVKYVFVFHWETYSILKLAKKIVVIYTKKFFFSNPTQKKVGFNILWFSTILFDYKTVIISQIFRTLGTFI